MFTLLKSKNFRKLYYSGFLSELGSFITETTLMLLVFEIGRQNKAYLGITRAAFIIFFTFGSLLGGSLGQRYNRKNILIFSNLSRIPLIFLLFIYPDHVYLIILLNSLIAFFTGIYNPIRQTLINDIVPPSQIPSANSMFSSSMAIIHIVGPLIGAYSFSYFRGISEVLIFDFLTYIVGIGLLLSLKYVPPKGEGPIADGQRFHFFSEIKDGLRLVKERLDLISLFLNCFIGGLCIGVLIPLLLPFVLENLNGTEKEYGVLLSLFGVGGIMGGLLSIKISKIYLPGKLITICICLEAILMNLLIQVDHYYGALIVFLIWGIVVFLRLPSQLNYLSKTVETKYLTRIHSLLDLSFIIPTALGGVLIAYFGEHLLTKSILQYTAITFFLLTLPRVFFKEMRALYYSDREQVPREV